MSILLGVTMTCPSVLADDKKQAALFAEKANVANREMKTRSSAVQFINQAIALDKTNAFYYHIRATIYWRQEEDALALQSVNRAIELDPKRALYYENKAIILQSMKRPQEALELLDRAIKMQDSPDYHITRASILSNMNRLKESKMELDKLIKQNPKNTVARIRRPSISAHLKCWADVIEDMTYLIASDDKNSVSHFLHFVDRGNAYMQLKQYDKAEQDLLFAMRKLPDRRETHLALISLYKSTGRTKEARSQEARLNAIDEDIQPFK